MDVYSFEEAASVAGGILMASKLSRNVVNWYGRSRLVEVIVDQGVFHALSCATKHKSRSSDFVSEVAQKAFVYYSWDNFVGCLDYLIEPLFESTTGGEYISKAFSVARGAIRILGVAQEGSTILHSRLEKLWEKERFGDLSQRVTETTRRAFLGLAASEFVSLMSPVVHQSS